MEKNSKSLYDVQESQIMEQSTIFVELLTKKGILEDKSIDDERIRKAKQATAQKAYHNTEFLLTKYRMILWVLECVPDDLAQELQSPLGDLDRLAEKIDIQLSLDNAKLENRISSTLKTRALLDRVLDALAVVRKKPDNGKSLYNVIYYTYISPTQYTLSEICEKMKISIRSYYRFRKEAISIMSVRLWSAPSKSLDAWLEVMTLLEDA